MVKEFLNRNKSVFLIGFVTFLVFVGIIISSAVRRSKNTNYSPELIKIDDQENSQASDINKLDENSAVDEFGDIVESTESTLSYSEIKSQEIDSKYGELKIEYDTNGFSPTNTKAVVGQVIRFVNKTDSDITIRQDSAVFDEFKTPVTISAKGVYEFRASRTGVWVYKNPDNNLFGSIIILKP